MEQESQQIDQQATNAALAALAAAGNSFALGQLWEITKAFSIGCSGSGTARTRPPPTPTA